VQGTSFAPSYQLVAEPQVPVPPSPAPVEVLLPTGEPLESQYNKLARAETGQTAAARAATRRILRGVVLVPPLNTLKSTIPQLRPRICAWVRVAETTAMARSPSVK